LYLIHLDLASAGKTDIFFKDANGSLPIGEIGVQINGVVVDLGEGLGFVRNSKAFTELRYVEDVMELG
jgi:hypothetical protein